MIWRNALAAATRSLASAGVPDPARDARRLAQWASGLAPAAFSAAIPDPVPAAAAARLETALAARAARRPVSQITGERTFWSRDFHVTDAVLDPRPETESLVEAALARPFATVLDLGTGSGCILVTLLAERPDSRGIGIDASAAALAIAARNARRHHVSARAQFRVSDWFAAVEERVDLIVANPPYLAAAEWQRLDPEPRLYEPREALVGGADGLGAYRAITAGAPAHLAQGGRLLLEIGPTQAVAVSEILSAGGLRPHPPLPDLDGRDRVILATGR